MNRTDFQDYIKKVKAGGGFELGCSASQLEVCEAAIIDLQELKPQLKGWMFELRMLYEAAAAKYVDQRMDAAHKYALCAAYIDLLEEELKNLRIVELCRTGK